MQSLGDLTVLDRQLARWGDRLSNEVRVPDGATGRLASAIAEEMGTLADGARTQLRPIGQVGLADRVDELVAFQAFMDSVPTGASPAVVRAQVIVQNYLCFVYLGESLFRSLRSLTPSGSATRRCCSFLTDNPVRAFRNAIAHGNWRYNKDFSGLEFWARKGSSIDEPMVRWEVSGEDLEFWQAVARCTGYVATLALRIAG